jgi:hypothetical protein
MVEIPVHGIAFKFKAIPIKILSIDLLPLSCSNNKLSVKEDPIRNIEDMSIFFDKPFDSLTMFDFLAIVAFCGIFYNKKELLEVDKSVVVVFAFVVS